MNQRDQNQGRRSGGRQQDISSHGRRQEQGTRYGRDLDEDRKRGKPENLAPVLPRDKRSEQPFAAADIRADHDQSRTYESRPAAADGGRRFGESVLLPLKQLLHGRLPVSNKDEHNRCQRAAQDRVSRKVVAAHERSECDSHCENAKH